MVVPDVHAPTTVNVVAEPRSGTGSDTLTGYFGNHSLNTVDGVPGNDTANGSYGTDTFTTDPGDVRVSCP
ncbi:hypothetical protein [Streptomyces sp. NBC_00063]|uniref:hypothetical protein n=1 Tax=Streptomyces sp. NBC_00063 TaxID=2975638 RepID=UPI003D7602EC